MPEISIIIPAYNVEKYLKKCITSILNQTFTDFEVLLVDDGSTDSTPQLCDEMAQSDNRIVVFHKENGGSSDARNYALDRIKGEFLTFIDSDDYVHGDYLQTLYEGTSSQNTDISILKGKMVVESGISNNVVLEEWERISSKEAIRRMLLRKEIIHATWGKLYKSNLWKDVRFPKDYNYGEDYDTTYTVFLNADYVAFNRSELYYYVQRNGSLMHEKCTEKTLSVLDVSDRVTENLIEKLPSVKVEAVELQTAVYLKNLQAILNEGLSAFPEYQNRIIQKVKSNAKVLILSNKVFLKDKVKIILLLFGKRIFVKMYNKFDGCISAQ